MYIEPHAKRTDVFNALFALLKTTKLPTQFKRWNLCSQKMKLWDDIDAASQPAMFLMRGPQLAEMTKAYGVIKWTWKATVWIYWRADGWKTTSTDEKIYPDVVTDQFIENVEQVLQSDEGQLTLGGLVHHVFIDGTVVSEPGLLDNQAVIMIPITILL